MTEIVLASNNRKKIAELETFFASASSKEIKVKTLRETGWTEDIEEDGESFEENSLIKASVPARFGRIGAADDSQVLAPSLVNALAHLVVGDGHDDADHHERGDER